MGAKKSATRRSNGYWSRQQARTESNRVRRRRRHLERHPRDRQAHDRFGKLLDA